MNHLILYELYTRPHLKIYKINSNINNVGILNELQYFRLLLSDEILDLLVEESNNYYTNILIQKYGTDYKNIILKQNSTGSLRYLFVTKGISKEDILAFLGVRLYMGLHKFPAVSHYWKSNNINTCAIGTIMTYHYFLLISKSLHFPEKEKEEKGEENENNERSEDVSPEKIDPRHKINLYLEKLAKNFQKYYVLGKNITIDESLLHFRGRSSMKYHKELNQLSFHIIQYFFNSK